MHLAPRHAPSRAPASTRRGRHAAEARVGVAHDRQQRVERERHDDRRPPETADPELPEHREARGESAPAERRGCRSSPARESSGTRSWSRRSAARAAGSGRRARRGETPRTIAMTMAAASRRVCCATQTQNSSDTLRYSAAMPRSLRRPVNARTRKAQRRHERHQPSPRACRPDLPPTRHDQREGGEDRQPDAAAEGVARELAVPLDRARPPCPRATDSADDDGGRADAAHDRGTPRAPPTTESAPPRATAPRAIAAAHSEPLEVPAAAGDDPVRAHGGEAEREQRSKPTARRSQANAVDASVRELVALRDSPRRNEGRALVR